MDTEALYPILKSVHIISMRSGLVLIILAELLLLSGGFLSSAPRYFRWSLRMDAISYPLRVVGIAAGIAMAIMGGWHLLAPWLVLAYVLIILHNVFIRLFVTPWQRRIQARIADPNGVAVTEIQWLLREPRAILGRWLTLLVFLSIFPVMLLKPSFGAIATIRAIHNTLNDNTVAILTTSTQTEVIYGL